MRTRWICMCVAVGMVLGGLAGGWLSQAQQLDGGMTVAPVGASFTYQGYLTDAGHGATGAYDFQFNLYDAASGGLQVGNTLSRTDVGVTEGVFSVVLDFGSDAFTGEARWLQIGVRSSAYSGAYTILDPRQPVSATPYAIHAANADQLDGAHASGFLSTSGGTIQGNLGIGGSWSIAPLYVRVQDARRAILLEGGPTIGRTSLGSKWNLLPTGSGNARISVITNDFQAADGIGLILGDNVASPVVWMYDSAGRNAFTVAKKGFSTAGTDISAMDDLLTPLFQVRQNGNVGIGTTSPATTLDVRGTTRATKFEVTGGGDLAEPFALVGVESVEPGTVVAIDPDHAGQLRIADKAYDRTVAGIVSGANGMSPGLTMLGPAAGGDATFAVALTGSVYCLADAAYGPIKPGDLLTSSDTPGHAMVVTDYDRANGAVIGKAMTALDQGRGLVLVLAGLQ